MNYTVGQFLIQIKNACMAHKKDVILPYSKESLAIGKILQEEGYLKKITEKEENKIKSLYAELIYQNHEPKIHDIHLVSKPSLHRYVRKTRIPRTLGGYGI